MKLKEISLAFRDIICFLFVMFPFSVCSIHFIFILLKSALTYSPSCNLAPPISQVLIGQHLIFCSLTSPTCCNSPLKCTPSKHKKRQKFGFQLSHRQPLSSVRMAMRLYPLNSLCAYGQASMYTWFTKPRLPQRSCGKVSLLIQ